LSSFAVSLGGGNRARKQCIELMYQSGKIKIGSKALSALSKVYYWIMIEIGLGSAYEVSFHTTCFATRLVRLSRSCKSLKIAFWALRLRF
jgi:hypothetical protein